MTAARAGRRRWNQRFADGALEDDYQRRAAEAGQAQFRVVAAIALALWLAMYALDRQTAGSDDNLHRLLLLRYAVATPIGVLAAALGWLPIQRFQHLRPALAVALVAAYIGTPIAMALTVPEPAAFDAYSMVPAILASVVAACGLFALWGVRWDVIGLGVLPAVTVGWLAIVRRYPTADDATSIVSTVLAVVAAGLVAWWIDGARREAFVAARRVEEEEARSQTLIENMLPAPIAAQLKAGVTPIAEQVADATVLFGDLVGFTPLAAELAPTEVVATLDELFTELDEIAQRHGVATIKTIGDAYMAVCGAPTPRVDHAAAVAEMALEMRDLVAGRAFAGGRRLELRIGMHSGPLVAGVIGKKKFVYDLWGDTVNTASRMESHGVPGKVHVTAAVRARLDGRYQLVPRGPQAIKGKGEMETWLLERRSD